MAADQFGERARVRLRDVTFEQFVIVHSGCLRMRACATK
jgi:hypothetical protein